MASHPAYIHYGMRGITICPRWVNSVDGFENFVADMGERPPERSIDRIDVNRNYTPTNCRWATAEEQANNKRKPEWFEGTQEEWVAECKRADEFDKQVMAENMGEVIY